MNTCDITTVQKCLMTWLDNLIFLQHFSYVLIKIWCVPFSAFWFLPCEKRTAFILEKVKKHCFQWSPLLNSWLWKYSLIQLWLQNVWIKISGLPPKQVNSHPYLKQVWIFVPLAAKNALLIVYLSILESIKTGTTDWKGKFSTESCYTGS